MFMALVSPIAMGIFVFALMGYSKLWYKEKWQSWNHIRTVMSVIMFVCECRAATASLTSAAELSVVRVPGADVPVADTVLRYLNCVQ